MESLWLLPWVIVGTIEHNQRLIAVNEAAGNLDAENGPSDGPSLTIDQDEPRAEHEENEE
jgi:hypothetical protein